MTERTLDPKIRTRFTRPLLQWYEAAGRDLPWRTNRDPYAIWVSEIMLQQTQVATVRPYFLRFLNAFPTIADLAAADLEKVLKLWQGLGYYARARHLHRAASEVMTRFSGRLPATFEGLHSLPGIGRSTAGAILTIAFNKRYPILDGNVRRVLCRFFKIKEDPRGKSVEDWLWACSETLMPQKNRAGVYLQAIMDLGATICTPRQPDCAVCPVRKHCEARRAGLQETLPLKPVRKKIPHFDYFAGLLVCGDWVLIHRRPLTGLLAGLWEFPGARIDTPVTARLSITDYFERFFKKAMHQNFNNARLSMTIRHVFTHFKMTLHVFSVELRGQVPVQFPYKWVQRDALHEYAFSTAHQKIVSALPDLSNRPRLF